MFRRWPVRDVTAVPVYIEAPAKMADYDSVQIRLSLTPMRAYDGRDRPAGDSVHSIVWVASLEARDMRCLEYLARQLVDRLMREWNEPSEP